MEVILSYRDFARTIPGERGNMHVPERRSCVMRPLDDPLGH